MCTWLKSIGEETNGCDGGMKLLLPNLTAILLLVLELFLVAFILWISFCKVLKLEFI